MAPNGVGEYRMSLPNQKPAVVAPVAPATSPKTFEENVAILAKQPKMDNPYSNGPAGEPTAIAKIRTRNAHRFESEREKVENLSLKASGVSGAYGRVNSVVDGLRNMLSKNPDGTFTEAGLASMAEVAYVNAHPLKKKSTSGSSLLYTNEVAFALQLLGFLLYDPKGEVFRFTPALKTALQPKS
jgi:hypothetical protein